MAIAKVADRGSAANVTSSTTTLVDMPAAGSITVGNYLIVRVAADNSGASGAPQSVTVSDPRSNSWTTLTQANNDPGAASAGTTCSIAYAKVNNAFTNGDDITVTYGGAVVADAVVVEEWSGIHPTAPVAVAATTTTGTSTAIGGISRTPTLSGQMIYVAGSSEGPNADTYVEDADVTNGLWSSLTRLGSTAATATDNQKTVGAYKVVTASGAQTWTATITSRDWAAVALVFDYAPVMAAATADGAGDLSGAVGRTVLPAATATGAGDLTAGALLTTLAAATATATATLSAAAVNTTSAGATATGAGDLTAAGVRLVLAAATASGAGDLSAAGVVAVLFTAAALLAAAGDLTAAAGRTVVPAATATGAGDLTATGTVQSGLQTLSAAAVLTGAGQLVAHTIEESVVTVSSSGGSVRLNGSRSAVTVSASRSGIHVEPS